MIGNLGETRNAFGGFIYNKEQDIYGKNLTNSIFTFCISVIKNFMQKNI